jgi:hypothetical protein
MIESVIIIAVIAFIGYAAYKYFNGAKSMSEAVNSAASDVKETAKSAADVNGDGKVDLADAKAAATKVTEVAKKVAKPKTTTTRKPRAKKTT